MITMSTRFQELSEEDGNIDKDQATSTVLPLATPKPTVRLR